MKTLLTVLILTLTYVSIVSSVAFDPEYEYSGHKERWAGDCRRHRSTGLRQAPREFHTPDCNIFGGYEPRQCHNRLNYCWCVNEFGDPKLEIFPKVDTSRSCTANPAITVRQK